MATTGEAFIQNVKAEITGLQNMASQQSARLLELEQQVGTQQTNLVRLNGNFLNHEAMHDPYMKKVDVLEAKMMSLEARVQLLSDQLNDRFPKLEGKIANFRGDVRLVATTMKNEAKRLQDVINQSAE